MATTYAGFRPRQRARTSASEFVDLPPPLQKRRQQEQAELARGFAGIALDNDTPSRQHIHTVVRTLNGNDYGKDLLRQHHERFRHVAGTHVPR